MTNKFRCEYSIADGYTGKDSPRSGYLNKISFLSKEIKLNLGKINY